ncbi:MAG: cytochrome C peroxidase [Saprospiraceae bacterium]|nr:cytochrome C peroxidase [Saprospiraceae bacterium]
MKLRYIIVFAFALIFSSCGDDSTVKVFEDRDLTDIEYNPQTLQISYPQTFPRLEQPDDNLMTTDGVELGRHLFYDPILSADSTMSCASCHLPLGSFTDNLAVSIGIDNIAGKRSSMSLLNTGFYNTGLFWDGRSTTLEEQALLPVEDPIELHDTWDNVIFKLQCTEAYPEMFRKAFGIEKSSQITKELAAKAMAQFERSLVSSGSSKYDKVLAGKDVFTEEELMGFEIFFDINEDLPDGECFHCHNEPLLTTNEYLNNGLDSVPDFDSFEDVGYGAVTGVNFDNGKFRVPTLRNIIHSAPFMHDGRFQTLEEVLDHYNSGGKPSPNKHPLIVPLGLTQEHLDALMAFLHTLTDEEFMNNPAYSDPN